MVQPNSFSEAEELRLRRHALRMLLDRSSLASLAHILVAIGLAAYMSLDVPLWRGAVFAIGLSAGVFYQLILANQNDNVEWSHSDFLKTQRRFDISALWVGGMWGFAGFCLFPSGAPAQQLFLTFVMGGMSLSSVATQGMSLRTCYSSIIVGMTPLGVRYFMEGGLNGMLSGALIFLFIMVLVVLAQKINDYMLQAFRLQLEKDGLLEDVRLQAAELASAREAADEANFAKSRFLAQASHDLRQPLHAISLFIESLPHAKGPVEREDIMNRVRQSLDVLSKLFDSLLDVTLLDTGGIEVQSTVFRPNDIIAEVKHDFSLIAKACRVEIRSVPSTLAVKSDPVLLRRMLQNLISNAIRYSEGGRVLIGCRRRNGKLSVEVADTGPGISQRDQQRIFSEFTRLDEARMGPSAKPGLGLGLSIVKRIAQELGLGIRLRSQPDRGSVFSIDGFEISDGAISETGLELPVESGGVNNACVFVLDDDLETLQATELLLNRWGFQVLSSQDWRDLLDASPDVVICDYELSPEKTGLDVLRDYMNGAGHGVPAIMISGHTTKTLRQDAAAKNIPLLHKPVRPAQLRSALLNALAVSNEAARGGEGGDRGSA